MHERAFDRFDAELWTNIRLSVTRAGIIARPVSHGSRETAAVAAAQAVAREHGVACDDAVLRKGARASDYAEHLLSIAGSGAAGVPSAALAMARPSAFEGRLLAILEPDLERSSLSRLKVAAATLLFLALILPLAAASPTAKAEAMVPPGARETVLVQDPSPEAPPAPEQPAETVPEKKPPGSLESAGPPPGQ